MRRRRHASQSDESEEERSYHSGSEGSQSGEDSLEHSGEESEEGEQAPRRPTREPSKGRGPPPRGRRDLEAESATGQDSERLRKEEEKKKTDPAYVPKGRFFMHDDRGSTGNAPNEPNRKLWEPKGEREKEVWVHDKFEEGGRRRRSHSETKTSSRRIQQRGQEESSNDIPPRSNRRRNPEESGEGNARRERRPRGSRDEREKRKEKLVYLPKGSTAPASSTEQTPSSSANDQQQQAPQRNQEDKHQRGRGSSQDDSSIPRRGQRGPRRGHKQEDGAPSSVRFKEEDEVHSYAPKSQQHDNTQSTTRAERARSFDGRNGTSNRSQRGEKPKLKQTYVPVGSRPAQNTSQAQQASSSNSSAPQAYQQEYNVVASSAQVDVNGIAQVPMVPVPFGYPYISPGYYNPYAFQYPYGFAPPVPVPLAQDPSIQYYPLPADYDPALADPSLQSDNKATTSSPRRSHAIPITAPLDKVSQEAKK